MKKIWNIQDGANSYEVSASYNHLIGKLDLIINGERLDYRPMFFAQITGFDVPIKLGDTKAMLQVIGRKLDLAVNGYFLDSKKEFKPIMKMPFWNWLFILLTVIIPVLLPGALPMLLALFALMYTIRISTSPKLDTAWKILICFFSTVCLWFCFGIIIMLIP